MSFGDRLKDLRARRGLSQQELADRLGTTKQVISRYELNQRDPKSSLVLAWANKLGVSYEYLIGAEIPQGFLDMYGDDVEAAYRAFEAAEVSVMLDGSERSLTPAERELLRVFRNAEPAFREEALQMLKRHPMK
jgi:transcriptional regulator with XRE-family HTH domain